MKVHLFFLFAFILFTNSKCRKTPAVIDPKPQPDNSIKATIDGVTWETHNKGVLNRGTSAFYFLSTNDFSVGGIDWLSPNHDEMVVYVKNFQLNEKKKLGRQGSSSFALFNIDRHYITNDTITGNITINSIDTVHFIVNGVFDFNAIDTLTGKIIKVENGIFKNVTYIYQ